MSLLNIFTYNGVYIMTLYTNIIVCHYIPHSIANTLIILYLEYNGIRIFAILCGRYQHTITKSTKKNENINILVYTTNNYQLII